MKLGYILPIFLLLTFSDLAQDYKIISNTEFCKKLILDHHKSTKSISADFIEKIHSSMFETAQKGTGRLVFKQSKKIRWEHFTPKKQVIVLNANSARISENGKEVKSNTNKLIFKKIQEVMIQMFSGEFLSERDFNVVYYENLNNYKLSLKHKSKKVSRFLSQIDLYFEKKSLFLVEMCIVEQENERVVYTFSNVQWNKEIEDSIFDKL